MTFATPILAAIAAGIVIPSLIILYFLKLRRRDMEVSSTLLWKKAIQDLQANAPFQKLRNNILLILQLLALAAALFALAQPEMRSTAATRGRQIIMIDRSASMNAGDAIDPKAGEGASGGDAKPVSRLEAAKKQAIAFVDSLKEPTLFDDKAQEAMVVAFDTGAEVRQSFTSNKALLKQAINSIEATESPSGLTRTFEIASAYTGTKKFEDQISEGPTDPATGKRQAFGFRPTGPGATLHIFSDGRLPDAEQIKPAPEDKVVYHGVGTSDAVNVGIVGLRAERAFDNPTKVSIFLGVESTDSRPRVVDVELLIDGVVNKVNDVTVSAAGVAVVEGEGQNTPRRRMGQGGFVFPIDRAAGGIAEVRINPRGDDALSADNVAYLTIPPARRLNVALVTNGNLFTQTALQGLRLSKFDVLSPSVYQKRLDEGTTGEYDVVVFDRVLPQIKVMETATPGAPANNAGATKPAAATSTSASASPPTAPSPATASSSKPPVSDPPPRVTTRRAGLPPGRSLVLGAIPPPPLGVVDEGASEADLIADYDRNHAALRFAALDKINIGKSRKVRLLPDTPVRVIASGKVGPAIFEITDATTQAIVVGFDVGETDWPFDPGWVLFLAGSLLHLSEAETGALSEGVRTGSTLQTRLPPGATGVRMTVPELGSLDMEPSSDGTVSFGPVVKTGVYTITWTGIATARDQASGSTATRRIAANLMDADETDIGALDKLAIATGDIEKQPEAALEGVRKLWPWLLLVALAVLMLEWFVYNRKVAV
jgi:hypothetical protein